MNYKDKNFKLNVKYQIHSIFDNVINLKYENKIYSLFNYNIKKAPYTLILEKDKFIYFKNYCNNFNEIYLDNIEYIEYESTMPLSNKVINTTKIKEYINNFIRPDNIFEKAFQEKRKNKDIINLLGLGMGLTPSGDDYIVGIMAAYYSKNLKINDKFLKITNISKIKTNEISFNYIQNASLRLFKEEIINLILDLNNDNKIKDLLNIGSTSGQDILYGIYDYFIDSENINNILSKL